MSVGARPEVLAPNQGYYEHALPKRDEEPKRGPIAARAVLAYRTFWLAAGILAGVLFIAFFVWIWVDWLRFP